MQTKLIKILIIVIFSQLGIVWGIENKSLQCQKKLFIVTAYYSPLPKQSYYYKGNYKLETKLNGDGIRGASGKNVFNGMIAAPRNYTHGTQILFPNFGVGEVADRGGAIVQIEDNGKSFDRIDIWMGKGETGLYRALSFGKKALTGYICPEKKLPNGFDFDKIQLLPTSTFVNTLWNSNLELGDKNDLVGKLQSYLAEMKYLTTKDITNYFDTKTEKAVCKFQIKQKILQKSDPLCGYFGTKTRKKLLTYIQNNKININNNSNISNISNIQNVKLIATTHKLEIKKINKYYTQAFNSGDKHEQITQLQKHLKKLGYYQGEINGIYNQYTQKSISKFQLKYSIIKPSDNKLLLGYFGPKTRGTLEEIVNKFEIF